MKTIEVKAKSAVQLLHCDGTILKSGESKTFDVEDDSAQMQEIVRDSELGLLSYEVVGASNTEAPKEEEKPKEVPKEPEPEPEPEPKEEEPVEETPEEPPKEEQPKEEETAASEKESEEE